MAYQVQQFKDAWFTVLTIEDEPSEALIEMVQGAKQPLRIFNPATERVLVRSRAAKKIKPPRCSHPGLLNRKIERRIVLVKAEEISRKEPDPFQVSGPRSILKRKPWIKKRFAVT